MIEDKKRADSWSESDDKVLIDTVLGFMKDGRTQLEAFEAVGMKLGRTPGACGFRWNGSLRQGHAAEIESIRKAKIKEMKSGSVVKRSLKLAEVKRFKTTSIIEVEKIILEHAENHIHEVKVSFVSNGAETIPLYDVAVVEIHS